MVTDTTPETQAPQAPTPDPKLHQFDPYIGTWQMTGRTIGSDVDDVSGTTTFAWLPGGFFVEQRTKIKFTMFEVESVEIIRYDPETDTFPSTVYPSMYGSPLPYRWTFDRDGVTIKAEALHATFHGRWSEDGKSFSGGWRADPGHESDPGNIAYDIWGSRAARG